MTDGDAASAGIPLLEALRARAPVEIAALPGVAVHLFSLAACEPRIVELSGLISAADRHRAETFGHQLRRSAYIAGRALLRGLLSESVAGDTPPSSWEFENGPYGKPGIAAPEHSGLHFSLSYSDRIIAIAVSRKFDLGVDIEALSPAGSDEVPWHVLTNAERHFLRTLPPEQQFIEFLRLWTLKEAYTKSLGLGATLDFRGVEVSLDKELPKVEAAKKPASPPLLHQRIIEIGGWSYVLAIGAVRGWS